MGLKGRRRSRGLARLADWFRANLRRRIFREFGFDKPAPASAIEVYEEVTGRSDLGAVGWSRYDGQKDPVEERVHWLPAGARWLSIGTAIGFCRFNGYPGDVLIATNYNQAFLTVDRSGRVVFDDWLSQRRAILGASIDELVDRYIELLESGELIWDERERAIVAADRSELWRALSS